MLKRLSLGNSPVFGTEGLHQHSLEGLAAHFSPPTLLSAAGNLGSGCKWVSVPTPALS